MQVAIISPEKTLYEGEAQIVSLPGRKSAFTVLPNHAPMISELETGVITLSDDNGKEQMVIDGGFAEVKSDKVIALVEGASTIGEINPEEDQKELDELTKLVTKNDSEEAKRQRRMYQLRVRLRIAAGD